MNTIFCDKANKTITKESIQQCIEEMLKIENNKEEWLCCKITKGGQMLIFNANKFLSEALEKIFIDNDYKMNRTCTENEYQPKTDRTFCGELGKEYQPIINTRVVTE